MLVMSKGALSAKQAESYYEEKYSQDDYYTEERRVVGRWFGNGAAALGLSGEVTTEAFRAVLRGLQPATGQVLVQQAGGYDDRRAGWDATFNAPKSVSIQALLGEDGRLLEAHRSSVSRALAELSATRFPGNAAEANGWLLKTLWLRASITSPPGGRQTARTTAMARTRICILTSLSRT